MGRRVAPDEVGGLLQAVGCGDVEAFAAFYDRTASLVFNFLQRALGESAAAERATVQVYTRVWRSADTFDPAVTSGCTFLLQAVRRELDGRAVLGRRTGPTCAPDARGPAARGVESRRP